MSGAHWQKIADRYRDGIEAGEFAPGTRLPSDARLAEEWGVSRPTAHRALAELARDGFVSRTRAGTVVAHQRSVAKSTNRVALIVDHAAASYDFPGTDLLRGIQSGIGDRHLLLCDSGDSAHREGELLRQMADECDGVLLVPTGARENRRLYGDPRGPLVVLDRIPEETEPHAVLSDNRAATLAGVRALLAEGHRRVAFLAFHKPHNPTVAERHAAYESALLEAGLDPEPALCRFFSADLETEASPRFQRAVDDALCALRSGTEPVTAVFCVQDAIAAAALDSSDAFGEPLAVAAFHDWPSAMLPRGGRAHRIVPRRFDIGRLAAERLSDLIRGESPEPRVLRVAAELVVPDRSAPAPAAFARS